jgi:ABC-type nitrate/sulfonate/bicarbonate transport system substrate-binding protein
LNGAKRLNRWDGLNYCQTPGVYKVRTGTNPLFIIANLILGFWLYSCPVFAAENLSSLYSAQAISYSLPWIAREAGLFQKYNLDFQLVYVGSSGVATAALIGGDVELALAGGVGFARAYVQGATDLAFIGGFKNILTHSIVGKPGILKPQDLRRKRIGISRLGSNSHYFAVQALRKFGLDPARNDVIFVQVGGDTAGLAALINGTIDATVMLTYGQTAIAQGFHYILYGPDLRIPYTAAGIVTRPSLIARRSRVFSNFMVSMAEAARIFHTDKEFTFKVLSKYLRIADRKILETSYDLEKPALEPRLEIRPEAISAILEEIAATEPGAKNVKPQQLIDRRYLDEMNKSGFLDKLWGTK